MRNKVLAPVFKRLGLIDQWGNGLALIHDELKAYPNVRMTWKEVGLSFQVAFERKVLASAESTQESTQETNKSTQEMILDEIRKHPFTTREQLAKVIGITPDGIKKQLDKMKKAKRIKHVGPTKGGHWEIITE